MLRSLLAATILFASPAFARTTLEGNWVDPQRSVTVHIAPCRRGFLCGRVISASREAQASAAAAGTPRLIGAELMSNLHPAGDGAWQGSFFVPDRNVRADGELHQLDARTIEIQGCAIGGLLCKSQRWTRANGPVKRPRR